MCIRSWRYEGTLSLKPFGGVQKAKKTILSLETMDVWKANKLLPAEPYRLRLLMVGRGPCNNEISSDLGRCLQRHLFGEVLCWNVAAGDPSDAAFLLVSWSGTEILLCTCFAFSSLKRILAFLCPYYVFILVKNANRGFSHDSLGTSRSHCTWSLQETLTEEGLCSILTESLKTGWCPPRLIISSSTQRPHWLPPLVPMIQGFSPH